MQLPLAIFGLALATVSLPMMSKSVAQKNIVDMKETLNVSIRFSIVLLVPATIALIVLGLPMIKVLFERGRFDHAASLVTNSALLYYSLGLPAYAIAKILANTFFSFQNTKTPVKVAFVVMLIHVLLCVILMQPLGVGGLALATSICAYLNSAMLLYKLRIKIGRIGIYKILNSTFKNLIASAVMGIVCYFIIQIKIPLFLSLTIAIIAGLLIFIGVSKLIKSPEIEQLLSAFLRKYYAKNS